MNIFKKAYNNLYPIHNDAEITSRTGGRVYLFDNAKFILTILVVFSHMVLALKMHDSENIVYFINASDIGRSVYYFLFLFHMPAFIVISGYFTKSIFNPKRIIGLISLYLCTQTVFFIFEKYVLMKKITLSYLSARAGLWYLIALCAMTILLPILTNNFKPQIAIAITVILGIACGYEKSIGDFLSLSRIFTFMPFFLIGHYLSNDKMKSRLNKFFNFKFRIIALLFLITMFILCYLLREQIPYQFLYGSMNYSALKIIPYGGLYRAIYYVLSLLTVFSILLIIPTKKTFFTKLGKNTLAVYIIHLLIFYVALKYTPMLNVNKYANSLVILTVLLAFSILLTFVLSWSPLSVPFNYLIKGNYKKTIENGEIKNKA